jgi:flagellar basal-body rod modification protein FlgD
MEVQNTPGITSGSVSNTGSGGFNSRVGRDQFMQMLMAQVRNQNPLEPMKEGEFMGQLAQFSMLEGIENLNVTFSNMLMLQQLTQGAQLIGRTVTYATKTGLVQGTVGGVVVDSGSVFLKIGNSLVPLEFVRSVEPSTP